jgi:hypothetical protein
MLADKVDDLRLRLIGVELPLNAVLSRGRRTRSKASGESLNPATFLSTFLNHVSL